MADSLTQIGTRDIFDSDHDMFREMTRSFFQNEVAPFHAEWEKAGEVPRELWTKAGELGLLANMVPEQYGGLGLDCKYPAIVWEEQSYSGCTGPGFAMHSDIVAPYITNYGTEEQKSRMLPKLVSGEWIGALAMTEPAAGSDFAGIKTTAKKDGDDYIINGSKVFITNGWLCDVVIVCAKTDAGKGAHGVSLFLVEDGMKGFIKGQKLNKMGLKAQDTSELFFEDLRVPASAMLGQENKGFMAVMNELPQARLCCSSILHSTAPAAASPLQVPLCPRVSALLPHPTPHAPALARSLSPSLPYSHAPAFLPSGAPPHRRHRRRVGGGGLRVEPRVRHGPQGLQGLALRLADRPPQTRRDEDRVRRRESPHLRTEGPRG